MRYDCGVGSRLLQAVREIFGSKSICAWLSGSFAYGGARHAHSDIDIVIVFDNATFVPADDETILRIRQFIDVYLAVHQDAGLRPDLHFPGEFLTEQLIKQAIGGRGFECSANYTLSLPIVQSDAYWLENPERWFRAWLSMAAFSRHLTGDRTFHESYKLAAWKTVLRYVLLRAAPTEISVEDVFQSLADFGVKPSYEQFQEVEFSWLQTALSALEEDETIYRCGTRYIPNHDRLCAWEQATCRKLLIQRETAPPFLIDAKQTDHLGTYATVRWESLV